MAAVFALSPAAHPPKMDIPSPEAEEEVGGTQNVGEDCFIHFWEQSPLGSGEAPVHACVCIWVVMGSNFTSTLFAVGPFPPYSHCLVLLVTCLLSSPVHGNVRW